MNAWRDVVQAFRAEFGGKHRRHSGSRVWPSAGRRKGGTAPRCPQCELFVRVGEMCTEPHNPCQVCTGCCPGLDTHRPPRKEPDQ